MSYIKATINQVRFRPLVELTSLLRPLTWIRGIKRGKGGKRKKKDERKGRKREGKDEKSGKWTEKRKKMKGAKEGRKGKKGKRWVKGVGVWVGRKFAFWRWGGAGSGRPCVGQRKITVKPTVWLVHVSLTLTCLTADRVLTCSKIFYRWKLENPVGLHDSWVAASAMV